MYWLVRLGVVGAAGELTTWSDLPFGGMRRPPDTAGSLVADGVKPRVRVGARH